MAKPLFIAEHACYARGIIGRVISKVMAYDTAQENRRAIQLLEVEGARRVMDFGCGHGRWLAALHRIAPTAKITGVDYSATMLREASARNKRLIRSGHVQVQQSRGPSLPFDNGHFDKILSMHTVYFLHPLEDYLEEFFRITAPGGDFVLGFRPGEDTNLLKSLPHEVYRMRSSEEIKAQAVAAGFTVKETIQAAPPSKSMTWLKLTKIS